ncbi:ABC transporter substrate-binding protein [Desulfovibrio mangrovi]|uniref:ABC transporter substrate-binding protein n=1 Tax=Desulfovibrio mangrovi TaxID=2976983 RepID=UPI002246C023|nr:ABC transporter substrate-binding protein [Desulfovibrio mangrovi]UZP67453.1 ABC transporter substrate-binding protein [Desulfovibrio mangrovi]
MKRLILIAVTLCLVFSSAVAFAGKIDEIKTRGTLLCGVKDSVVPFGYVDEASKQLVGFDVDICKALADKLGVGLELKTVTSATRIPMVTQGSIDIAAATMTHKHERDEVIDFSITYFMDGQKLLVAADSGINSVADLKGKKVATVKGSTSEKNILAAQPDCKVLAFDEYPQAMLAMKQGKAAAVTTDSVILVGLKGSDPEPAKWSIVGDAISAEPYALGIAENDSDFRDFINKSLNDMWRSGEYKAVYDKWLGPDTKYYMPLTWTMELWP